MAVLGISLIVASVVFVILRPPQWLLLRWPGFGLGGIAAITDGREKGKEVTDKTQRSRGGAAKADAEELKGLSKTTSTSATTASSAALKQRQPRPIIVPPSIQEPEPLESPTTPKAQAATPSQPVVPSLSLSATSTSMMPPPPRPSPRPSNGRIPALSQFPAPNSAQRARGPAPNRGLAAPSSSSSSSGLAPPPTLVAKPQKPSRQVVLTPGHSPLDWARISGPNADLRGVASSTPYLRVTPSMLKMQTGRKGKDAWMAINGKVYNVTPYARFHPGGVPELMRGAGRDGTKLFGEIHPWVNYETMLAACLVGLLVEESDSQENMDQMD